MNRITRQQSLHDAVQTSCQSATIGQSGRVTTPRVGAFNNRVRRDQRADGGACIDRVSAAGDEAAPVRALPILAQRTRVLIGNEATLWAVPVGLVAEVSTSGSMRRTVGMAQSAS